MKLAILCTLLGLTVGPLAAQDAAVEADQSARLRMALQIAREHNDRKLVDKAEQLAKQSRSAARKGNSAEVEPGLRELENQLGIDPGGWSMAGQPLFHGSAEMMVRFKALGPRLAEAMLTEEPARVRAVTSEMLAILGPQAGIPDGRRAGSKFASTSMNRAAATKLFLAALESERRRVAPLRDGKPLPDQMVRLYAYVLSATNSIRPFAAEYEPAALPSLDGLSAGTAQILLKLQQPEGHFPFPDLRGKNIRFGEMIENQIAAGNAAVRDGWVVSIDPDGGSQFDTGLCGSALLQAAKLHSNPQLRVAGLRAADWALQQPLSSNFNYNAFSVSLLAHAFELTSQTKYLEGALKKIRAGVAPGQAPNGRWIDPHNARTVYHLILLRSFADLLTVLPESRSVERAELEPGARLALKALLDEFEAMGCTVEALPELLSLAALFPEDIRLKTAVQQMAGSLIGKSTDGQRVKMGAQPDQLAAVPAALAP